MKKILIIGKNSFYFTQVKNQLIKNYILYEISHNDFNNKDLKVLEFYCIIIFSRARNQQYFLSINKNFFSNNIILVSSIILDLPSTFCLYSYYREKANAEKWFIDSFSKHSNLLIIRSGTIENPDALIYSNVQDFIQIVNTISEHKNFISLPLYKKYCKKPNIIYRTIFQLPFGFLFLRPFDILLRMKVGTLYGYVYAISKYLTIKDSIK
jgi:hypothetical protein